MNSMPRPEVYLSFDIEADGPIPGRYSMIEIGVAAAGIYKFDRDRNVASFERIDPTVDASQWTFQALLQPIADEWIPEALAVSGLTREELLARGEDPADAMTRLAEWLRDFEHRGLRPVMCAYPAPFDWMFLYWYLHAFSRSGCPLSHSACFDIKTAYVVRSNVQWKDAVKGRMPRELRSSRRHTHRALDDAIEQAELFANVLCWRPEPAVIHDVRHSATDDARS